MSGKFTDTFIMHFDRLMNVKSLPLGSTENSLFMLMGKTKFSSRQMIEALIISSIL